MRTAFRAPQGQILSNVVQDPTEVDNAFVINKRPENAFVINETEENAFVINAFVINSTFPMAPEDSRDKRLDAFTKEISDYDDSETKADPPSNKVRVTLRAYQLKNSDDITRTPANRSSTLRPTMADGCRARRWPRSRARATASPSTAPT